MDKEYNLPAQPREVPEFQPPGEEYPLPAEGYGTRAQEISAPGTGDETPPRKKSISRMLLTAVLGISVAAAAVSGQFTPAPNLKSTISQRLVEVGDWIGEDGTRAHFDEYSGWYLLPDDTPVLFTWDEWDNVAYTYNFKSSDETAADGSAVRTVERSFCDIVISEDNPDEAISVFDGTMDVETAIEMVPADTPTPEPAETYDYGDTLAAHWVMDYVSESDSDWVIDSSDLFAGYDIRVSEADFTEDTCTITYLDIYGGSKEFRYAWHYQEGTCLPVVLLEPLESIVYELPDRTIRSDRACEAAILIPDEQGLTLWMPSYLVAEHSTYYLPMVSHSGEEKIPSDRQPKPDSQPGPDSQPESDSQENTEHMSAAELLLSVGTWVSEDDSIIVHFDENGGWWKRNPDGNTYGLLSWWDEDGTVAYSGFDSVIERTSNAESSGESVRSLSHGFVNGYVEVLSYEPQPRIQMTVPTSGSSVFVPMENVWASSPSYFYDRDLRTELPGTGWGVAPFSTMESDKAAAAASGDKFRSNYIWISDASFEENTCTITFSDNYGGSVSYGFTWEYGDDSIEPSITLYPTEELTYELKAVEGNSTTTYTHISSAESYTAVMSISDDGPVLYLPNPFANTFYGATYEVMMRNR